MSRRYTKAELDAALSLISEGKSLKKVSQMCPNISIGTLHNKVHGKHLKPAGRTTALSAELESQIVKLLNVMADWHIPLHALQLRLFIQTYIQKQGINSRFKDDLPTESWVKGFKDRHKSSLRHVDRVKRSCSCVIAEIDSYFDYLSQELKDLPPENIINCDEINFCDDTGISKVLVTKNYGGRIKYTQQHTKQRFSVMFAGNAKGKFLPPMVVYNSEFCYEEGVIGGPKGTVYDKTKSGWFEGETLTRWFKEIILPLRQKLTGPIAIIGDILGSHFTAEFIELCLENSIKFITLVSLSSHLTQPLDFAVFQPLKSAWRKVLMDWRVLDCHPLGGIPKEDFAVLMSKLWPKIEKKNLLSGFKHCGVFPVNKKELLKRINTQESET